MAEGRANGLAPAIETGGGGDGVDGRDALLAFRVLTACL